MNDTGSRYGILVGLAAVAGALGTAAMMSAATAPTARADNEIFVPDISTFVTTEAEGFPPLVRVLEGTETWTLTGLPSGSAFIVQGVDTQTTFGSFTNDDFFYTNGYQAETGSAIGLPFLPHGTEIDVANFGGGFENDWMDVPAAMAGGTATITDTLITPFGDFTLF